MPRSTKPNPEIELKYQQIDNWRERQKEIEKMFSDFFAIIPIRYGVQFEPRLIIDDKEDLKALKEFQDMYPDFVLGIDGNTTYISLASILSSLGKCFTGKEVRLTVDEERNINGIKFL